MDALLLLLADGRWPGGGHAHSGGLEAAVADGSVHDAATLAAFAEGRLATVGAVDAWLAAAAVGAWPDERALVLLERECEARVPSPALRRAGRRLGRGLRRSVRPLWPAVGDLPIEQHPVVLGAVVAAGGGTPHDGARLALHGHLTAVVTAAPKLFAIDMVDAMAVGASLTPLADRLGREALVAGAPAWSAPLLERRADDHAHWEVRLFAS